jgi:hypothetical protein
MTFLRYILIQSTILVSGGASVLGVWLACNQTGGTHMLWSAEMGVVGTGAFFVVLFACIAVFRR